MSLRRNDVVTLSRRNGGVIIALCVGCNRTTLPIEPRLHYIIHTVHWFYCGGCWFHLDSAYLHIIDTRFLVSLIDIAKSMSIIERVISIYIYMYIYMCVCVCLHTSTSWLHIFNDHSHLCTEKAC